MAGTAHSGERRPLPASLVEALEERFRGRFQRGDAVLGQHGSSESHFAPVLPDAVVFARSTDDVVALVNLCAAADIPIVPFGAGTSIEGNALAVNGGISLDMSQMDQVLAVNAEDFDCVVQPGVRREELNLHLRDQDCSFRSIPAPTRRSAA